MQYLSGLLFFLIVPTLIGPGCPQHQSQPHSMFDLVIDTQVLASTSGEILDDLQAAVMADSFPNTTSVLIARHDTLVYEGYFGYGDELLLNDTRSSTKSLTALAVGAAVHRGTLSEDSRVFDILGDLAPFEHDDPLKKEITVSDLLTMSSALDCNDNDSESPGNEENMYPRRNWTRWAVDIPVKSDYMRDVNGRGPFSYCTAGSFLLGQVIERVTGQSVDRFFEERLFEPLGIELWQWGRSPTGEFMTGGGLRLTARDLVKIATMVLHEGRWGDKQVLPARWIQEATSAHLRANEEQTYGYQFWRRNWQTTCGPIDAAYMSGNGGNAILIMPELDVVVVVTRQHYGQRGMHQQTIRIIEGYVLPALGC